MKLPEMFIKVEHLDKDGQIFKTDEFKANSIVKAFIGFLSAQSGLGNETLTETDGTTTSSGGAANNFGCNAGIGIATYGIVVGSGTTAIAISDNKLTTLITHGTTGGGTQISYGAMSRPTAFTVSGSDAYFTLRRTFTNNTGGNVTIEEIGLYTTWSLTTIYICVEHSLYSTTVTNGNAIVVTYTIKATV